MLAFQKNCAATNAKTVCWVKMNKIARNAISVPPDISGVKVAPVSNKNWSVICITIALINLMKLIVIITTERVIVKGDSLGVRMESVFQLDRSAMVIGIAGLARTKSIAI